MAGTAAVLASPWLVLLLAVAWLFTVTVVATAMYRFAKLVIDKTDSCDLPVVLVALAQLLHSAAGLLKRAPDPPALGEHPPKTSAPVHDSTYEPGEGGQTP